jgi:hypothetical protein
MCNILRLSRTSVGVQGNLLKCVELAPELLVPLFSMVSDGFSDEPSEGLTVAAECPTSLQPLVSMDPEKMEAAMVSVSLALEEAPGKVDRIRSPAKGLLWQGFLGREPFLYLHLR